jgi:hypothetical protein
MSQKQPKTDRGGRPPKHNVRRYRDSLRDLGPDKVDQRTALGRAARKFKTETRETYGFDEWGTEHDRDLDVATHYHLRVLRDGPLIEGWQGNRKDLKPLQEDYDTAVKQRTEALSRLREAQEAAAEENIPAILEGIRERDAVIASTEVPAEPVTEIPTPSAPFQIDLNRRADFPAEPGFLVFGGLRRSWGTPGG